MLSQPLHDCNDTNHADHVSESQFLGNLGKMSKYQPRNQSRTGTPGCRSNEESSDGPRVTGEVQRSFHPLVKLKKTNWHFEKTFRR